MYKYLLICIAFASVIVCASGCSKDSGTDSTTGWVGIYTSPSPTDTISSLIISSSSDHTLRIDIKAVSGSYIYSYTTLHSVAVNSPTQSTIHESDNLIGGNGPYDIQGSLTLSGGEDITLMATATQGADVQTISFFGHKQ